MTDDSMLIFTVTTYIHLSHLSTLDKLRLCVWNKGWCVCVE